MPMNTTMRMAEILVTARTFIVSRKLGPCGWGSVAGLLGIPRLLRVPLRILVSDGLLTEPEEPEEHHKAPDMRAAAGLAAAAGRAAADMSWLTSFCVSPI